MFTDNQPHQCKKHKTTVLKTPKSIRTIRTLVIGLQICFISIAILLTFYILQTPNPSGINTSNQNYQYIGTAILIWSIVVFNFVLIGVTMIQGQSKAVKACCKCDGIINVDDCQCDCHKDSCNCGCDDEYTELNCKCRCHREDSSKCIVCFDNCDRDCECLCHGIPQQEQGQQTTQRRNNNNNNNNNRQQEQRENQDGNDEGSECSCCSGDGGSCSCGSCSCS